jgi:pimeloyl-ACP methyl ester carboxylesterase
VPYKKIDDQTRLYYQDVGKGPAVIFVHGFSMTHAAWETQVHYLSQDFRCVTVDLRGHGYSDRPPDGYSIDQNAKDLKKLIDKLDLPRPNYVGWSLGVAIGIKLVDLYGNIFEKMVLVGGTPCWGRLPDFPHAHEQEDIDRWIEEIVTSRPQWSKQFVEKMFHNEPDPMTELWLWNQSMLLPLHAAVATIEDSRITDLRPALSKFSVPTAIFHGKHDVMDYIEAGEYMAEKIDHAVIETFENSGHVPFFEEQEEFNHRLKRFLSQESLR